MLKKKSNVKADRTWILEKTLDKKNVLTAINAIKLKKKTPNNREVAT